MSDVGQALARYLAAVQQARYVHQEATRVAKSNYQEAVEAARVRMRDEDHYAETSSDNSWQAGDDTQ